MNKDVIYIDVEDDVTAIIGKVKDTKEKVVALVPPKRIGVLQSAVNLRILQRVAKAAGKHLVLITNDQALIPLAAGASIPVAKNLQTKPEIPTIAALKIDDDDDIIDGSQLPVGDHAATAQRSAKHIPVTSAPSKTADDTPYAVPPKAGESPRKPKGTNVPNFNKFRKKILLIGGALVLLITFLVWAIFFAPNATVQITAKTSQEKLATSIAISPTAQTDADKGTLRSVTVQEKQDASVDFTATGTQDQGTKASGTVTFSTNSISKLGSSVPAGTQLTSPSGLVYTTTQSVTITTSNYSGAATGIVASSNGDQYNGLSGDISGAPSGINAQVTGATSGGTQKTIKIVTQGDVQTASQQLASQNSDDMKTKLQQKFGKDIKVIDSSFVVSRAAATSAPQVGQEAADGKAKLTSSVTYSLSGIDSSELEQYLNVALTKKLSKENDQRVYQTGVKDAQLSNFVASADGSSGTMNISASGQVGPQIKDDDVKNRVKGKKFGDIQADLKSIQGVDDVDVQFWPFWVTTVPNDSNKITIKFKLIQS